ncbi:MAG TPA: aspartate--tRNA(Asn) ligase [Candidatus Methanofastidiosa archaeon]|nr:aspartate--tRNA(Asn) ligase [Candidatus Methanofastidiosa archaeon]HPR41543.1 aspartate--tRNA(Asn) ligase [Candidatus Methanofastidiosa archaeon]
MDTLHGWISEIRDMGGIKFIILRNRDDLYQITLPKKRVSEELFSSIDNLNKEDVILVEGSMQEAKSRDFSTEMIPERIVIINKSTTPLPLDPNEKVKAELDTRLDNRFLDIRKPWVSSIFKIRHSLLKHAREYLDSQDFLEIHTSKIISASSEGGTELFPIKYFEKNAFLSQSPQLYKQMTMAGGFERIYEIAWYFRAEEHNTTRHLNESTAIDIEMSFIDSEEDVMCVLENLIHNVLKGLKADRQAELEMLGVDLKVPQLPFKRLTYDNAIDILTSNDYRIEWGEDLGTEGERVLGNVMMEEGHEYYFIKSYPRNKVFYIMPDGEYCRGFDLDCKGIELTSGGQRCHEYDVIYDRIMEFGMNPENFKDYLKIFKYGMPPHGGFGFGIERWMMEILDLKNIRECILFPRDRNRTTP